MIYLHAVDANVHISINLLSRGYTLETIGSSEIYHIVIVSFLSLFILFNGQTYVFKLFSISEVRRWIKSEIPIFPQAGNTVSPS